MSIWKVPLEYADIGNVIGYGLLLFGAVMGGGAAISWPLSAQIMGLFAAILTVFGVFLTFWASSVRDRHSDLAIVTARAAAEQAHAKASEAEERAAEHQLKIAELAITQAETLAKFGHRTFAHAEQARFDEGLNGTSLEGARIHFAVAPGEESKAFMQALVAGIHRDGVSFTYRISSIMVIGAESTGVDVTVCWGPHAEIMANALRYARPDFTVSTFMSQEDYAREKANGGMFAIDPNVSLWITIKPKPPL